MDKGKYSAVTPELLEALRENVSGNVYAGAEINADYSHDEMPLYGTRMPEAVVEARSTDDVAAVMRLCHAHHVPVTPRGAGTGLVGGAVPVAGGVVLSTVKMNRILDYDMENFVVKVQSGVLLNDLAEDAAARGLLYPPDPGEKFATLGGNVSTNAGGMRAVKYGTTRDYVLAMTVVLPDGKILELGSAVSKSSSGYSLMHLIIGSEGTLGIITELTLKLIPMPKDTISLIIPFADLDTCISTVPRFQMEHLAPQALEFMERAIVEDSEAYLGKAVFPKSVEGTEVGAYLLVTFDGNSSEELENILEPASEMLLEAGALDIFVADTPAKKKDAWAARSSFLEAIMADAELLDECDVVVPVNRIAPFLTFVTSLNPGNGLQIKSFGHAGDGNLHIYLCGKGIEKEEFLRCSEQFMSQVYKKAKELGGLVSGEHGIGYGKIGFLQQSEGDTIMHLMQEIKRVFDPDYILNPGKVCNTL